MARTAGSWSVLGALTAIAALQTWGCDAPDVPDGLPDVQVVLDGLPGDVIVPAIERFQVRAVALQAATDAWSASGQEAERDVAKAAFAEAMQAWQQVEAMQVGPTASSGTSPLGQDFRDRIYSWPTINPCRVDQETVEANWNSPTFFTDNLVNTLGLDAIEHLLWAGSENVCPGQIPINAEGTWDALGPAGITNNRAAFTAALVNDVVDQTDALLVAWSTHRLDAATYGSEQEALNAVFDALFYLELGVQDLKLAEPLGVRSCTSDCLDRVESVAMSGGSNIWIANNLVGIGELFRGGTGAGLDDLLTFAGRGQLADDFNARLSEAQAAIEGLPGPIDLAIIDDQEAVQDALDAVGRASDLLSGDIATVLALQIPNEAAGDND